MAKKPQKPKKDKNDKRPEKLKDWASTIMVTCPRKGHEIGEFKTDPNRPRRGHYAKLKMNPGQNRAAGESMCCKVCGSPYIVDGRIHTSLGWYPDDPVLEPVPLRKR